MQKLEKLRELIRSYGSCVVAYSGGVDSVFLARVAQETLGEKSLAVIADSPSLPRRELADALSLAKQFGFDVRVIKTREFENPEYLSNPNNRCYFCKHDLFSELIPIARQAGLAVIVYGENASDIGDFRPGAQAAAEFKVRAPLKEAALTKGDIRELSAHLGLPTKDKPQMACLSSRVPYGERVTPQKLKMIEEAENVLRDMGFYEVRVRHHELPEGVLFASDAARDSTTPTGAQKPNSGQSTGVSRHLARIELGSSEMSKLMENGASLRVVEALKEIGYLHVTLDLAGYRRGSLNQGVTSI